MPRWLKTLYRWISRRRQRHTARGAAVRRASYPQHTSARPSRSSTPGNRSRSRSISPTLPLMQSMSGERVTVASRPPPPQLPPQHVNVHHSGAQLIAQPQRPMATGPRDAPRRQTAPPTGAYTLGYVTLPGQQQPTLCYIPVRTASHPHYVNKNPFVSPYEMTMNGYQSHQPPHTHTQVRGPAVRTQGPITRPPIPPPRTRTLPTPYSSRTLTAWKRYQEFWNRHRNGVASGTKLTFNNIPWPVVTPPKLPTSLTVAAVKAFLFSSRHSVGIPPRERVENAQMIWNPASFIAKFGPYVAPEDREKVERAINFLRGTLLLLHEEVAPIEESQ